MENGNDQKIWVQMAANRPHAPAKADIGEAREIRLVANSVKEKLVDEVRKYYESLFNSKGL